MEPVAHQGMELVDAGALNALGMLLKLGTRARDAKSLAELGFILANETHQLMDYRQAAVWSEDGGITTLSGVVNPEANAPYVQWLDRLIRAEHEASQQSVTHGSPDDADGAHGVHGTDAAAASPGHPATASGSPVLRCLTADSVADEIAHEWGDWLPAQALLLLLPASHRDAPSGAVLFARDEPWTEGESGLLLEWLQQWWHAEQSLRSRLSLTGWWWRVRRQWAPLFASEGPGLAYLPTWIAGTWSGRIAALLLLACFYPVPMTVLAPSEIVASKPLVLRSPQDGVVDEILVTPNQTVKAGDVLARLETLSLRNRLNVAEQGLVTAEAEYRQAAQIAVFDARGKSQLAMLQGKIREKQTEVQYLKDQLDRASLKATQAGVVIMDDPTELLGKPVVTGERVMSLSNPGEVEVEAWLSASDLIELKPGSTVTVFLNSAPLTPVNATLRLIAHEAVMRPDGSFAYRVRADLAKSQTLPRLGLKGTAKLYGERVPLAYWMVRRPLAVIRQTAGL